MCQLGMTVCHGPVLLRVTRYTVSRSVSEFWAISEARKQVRVTTGMTTLPCNYCLLQCLLLSQKGLDSSAAIQTHCLCSMDLGPLHPPWVQEAKKPTTLCSHSSICFTVSNIILHFWSRSQVFSYQHPWN